MTRSILMRKHKNGKEDVATTDQAINEAFSCDSTESETISP